jgi:hypothetical protein
MKADPIRLAGQQVISLEALPGWELLPEITFEPGEVYGLRWDRLLRKIKADPQERLYLRKRYRDGTARAAVQEDLQWSRQEVDRIRMRVSRKLRKLREEAKPSNFILQRRGGSSLHLAFRERVAGGRLAWELVPLDKQFLRIMAGEWPSRIKHPHRKCSKR